MKDKLPPDNDKTCDHLGCDKQAVKMLTQRVPCIHISYLCKQHLEVALSKEKTQEIPISFDKHKSY